MNKNNVEHIVDTYGDMLFRFCLITLGNCADAEDVIQETIIRYIQKAPVFENSGHEKAWLLTVAANRCKDLIRFRNRHPTTDIEEIKSFAEEYSDSGILDALMTLPEKFRTVLSLYYIEEYSINEIAQIIRKTPSAVKMRLQKGRRLLKEIYQKEYKLLNELKSIKIPEDIQNRITDNIKTEMEKQNMNEINKIKFLRKPLSVAASLALCICLAGLTAMAATGRLEGFFKDITDKNGAVTGTEYYRAENVINLTAEYKDSVLTLDISVSQPHQAPYSEIDHISLENFKITDENGMETELHRELYTARLSRGQARLDIPLDSISAGSYRIVITGFTGYAKAEQPLGIYGNWNCTFTVK